jgi:prepilin-type N-terminal cleavage/methylation domain-containing protein
MSKLKAFTLIELLIVLVLISVATFLVITFQKPTTLSTITPENLREFLYPSGEFYLFDDGSNLAVLKDKNITNVNINLNTPEVLIYKNGYVEKKEFEDLNDKQVVFNYKVKNGIGESFILKANDKYYVFKPFIIEKTNSLEKAKDLFLLSQYRDKDNN